MAATANTQWSQHCNRLRGRTENSIKNYWNATLRSKQAAKRRGFLWGYIDKVRGALDDEELRHRAFADTVRFTFLLLFKFLLLFAVLAREATACRPGCATRGTRKLDSHTCALTNRLTD